MSRRFRAVCGLGYWTPLHTLPSELLPHVDTYGPEWIPSRWNRKAEETEVQLRCSATFTDRGDFEEHMKAVHGRRSSTWVRGLRSTPPYATRRWAPPRLTEDGKPWEDKAGRTQTCPACGLIAEVSGASCPRWVEHLQGCQSEVEA